MDHSIGSTITFLLFALLLSSCSMSRHVVAARSAAETVQRSFIPDGRTQWHRISVDPAAKKTVILRGSTVVAEAHSDLLSRLDRQGIAVLDSVRVLPNALLKDQVFGIVNVSVANIRSLPKHSAELSTQALMGMVLRVWDVDGSWYLVQTPDDYFGWLDADAFIAVNDDEQEAWVAAQKIMVTAPYGFAYQKPDEKSQKVSDLVAGVVLPQTGPEGDHQMVTFPDGRLGYLPKGTFSSFREIKNSATPTADSVLTAAKEYLGRPYLWGGTSGKGLDCSGFTKTVFHQFGYVLPRDASQQVRVGKLVTTSLAEIDVLQKGDLLFFGTYRANGSERVTHVGFYLGNCEILHAAGSVKIQSLCASGQNYAPDRRATFLRAQRILGATAQDGVLRWSDVPWY